MVHVSMLNISVMVLVILVTLLVGHMIVKMDLMKYLIIVVTNGKELLKFTLMLFVVVKNLLMDVLTQNGNVMMVHVFLITTSVMVQK